MPEKVKEDINPQNYNHEVGYLGDPGQMVNLNI